MDVEEAEFEFSSSSGRIELNNSSHQSLSGENERVFLCWILIPFTKQETCLFSTCFGSPTKISLAATATK